MSDDLESGDQDRLGDDPAGDLKRQIICSLLWERRENLIDL